MFFRFVLVGGTGFVIDAGITYLLIQLSVAASLARIPAIFFAMAFTWLANRHFTYEVKIKRTAKEGFHYLAVAVAMAAINYVIFLACIQNGMPPLVAVTVATACQTVLSFYAYRHLVFRGAK